MGVSSNEKNDLATYEIRDMAKTWCTQWMDNRALRADPISWEVINKEFLDRFFPWEKRESKLINFITLHKGGMSVIEFFEIH